MGRYSLQIKQSVAKDLRTIPKKDVRRILKRIESLQDDPRPHGCEKLTNQERYRLRQGSGQGETLGFSKRTDRYRSVRIVYEIQDDILVVCVIKIAARSRVYR